MKPKKKNYTEEFNVLLQKENHYLKQEISELRSRQLMFQRIIKAYKEIISNMDQLDQVKAVKNEVDLPF